MTDIGARILVPLDGSALAEQALPYARAIAAPGAECLLVEVAPSLAPVGAGGQGRGWPERANGWLTAAAARLRAGSDLRVETLLGHGEPKAEILRLARERSVDVVVMASHGRDEGARRFLGSVADRVASEASLPVLVVRAREGMAGDDGPGIRRLVVPLDGSARSLAALAAAETLATRRDLPLWLIAAVDPVYAAPPADVPDAARASRDVLAELRAEAQRMLEQAGARVLRGGGRVAWHVLDGPAAAAILGAAGEGDAIVIASRGRGAAGRWPIGSVAEKVVRYAPVPVLVHHGATVGERAVAGAD